MCQSTPCLDDPLICGQAGCFTRGCRRVPSPGSTAKLTVSSAQLSSAQTQAGGRDRCTDHLVWGADRGRWSMCHRVGSLPRPARSAQGNEVRAARQDRQGALPPHGRAGYRLGVAGGGLAAPGRHRLPHIGPGVPRPHRHGPGRAPRRTPPGCPPARHGRCHPLAPVRRRDFRPRPTGDPRPGHGCGPEHRHLLPRAVHRRRLPPAPAASATSSAEIACGSGCAAAASPPTCCGSPAGSRGPSSPRWMRCRC